MLRNQILTTALTRQTEQRLMFRSTMQTIHSSLTLAGISITHDEILAILMTPKYAPSSTGVAVLSYHNALKWITQHWLGNSQTVSVGDLQVLATLLVSRSARIDRLFVQNNNDIDSLTTYITSHKDHPIILAGLVHAHFLTHPLGPIDNGRFARIAHTLIVSQYGYTLRGLAMHGVEPYDIRAYSFAQSTIKQYGQCTQWLEYIANTIEMTYKRLQLTITRDMRSSPKLDRIDRASQLSKREEDILMVLLLPTTKITNRQIQRQFHISPMTANRHLKKLTSVGFLYPHGKGRSVYYTKI